MWVDCGADDLVRGRPPGSPLLRSTVLQPASITFDPSRRCGIRMVSVCWRSPQYHEPIKSIGEHIVPVHLGVGVDAQVTVVVEAHE